MISLFSTAHVAQHPTNVTSTRTRPFVVCWRKRHLLSLSHGLLDSLGFQYGLTGQFNWTRFNPAAAVSQGVNPLVDHSSQTNESYYMLAEGNGRKAKDLALLLTPTQDRSTGSCLHFWYYQRALPQPMRLSIYLAPSGPVLWSHVRNLEEYWSYAQITVKSPDQPWQAVFEAEVSVDNANTSVAIDDVSITRGQCPNPGDCNFEVDLCGWVNDKNDVEMDWLVGDGVHSFGTGPQFGTRVILFLHQFHSLFLDHTTNTAQGKYLMIETSSPTKPGDRARLESEVFDGTEGDPRCFRFWYHM